MIDSSKLFFEGRASFVIFIIMNILSNEKYALCGSIVTLE